MTGLKCFETHGSGEASSVLSLQCGSNWTRQYTRRLSTSSHKWRGLHGEYLSH